MKNSVFTIVALSIMGFSFAQDGINEPIPVALDEATISAVNAHYLSEVLDENTPDISRAMQQKAAHYNLSSNPDFNPREKKTFEMVFKASNGDLWASYSPKGEILHSRERYRDVTLPMNIRREVFDDENQGYRMEKNQFQSVFQGEQVVKKVYKIHLTDGDTRKKLIIELKSAEE